MWSRVAEEMAIPWRAAEAMHWQLEEQEMARRAGVVPFSLTNATSILTSRRESATRSMCPPLPSVAELTAGVPSPRTCLGVGLYVAGLAMIPAGSILDRSWIGSVRIARDRSAKLWIIAKPDMWTRDLWSVACMEARMIEMLLRGNHPLK
jgi:hypothetical protein